MSRAVRRSLLFTRNSALGGFMAIVAVGATQFAHGLTMNETIVGLCGAWLTALAQWLDPSIVDQEADHDR